MVRTSYKAIVRAMHTKAVVDGTLVAETDKYEVVKGNIYVCHVISQRG